MTEFREQTLRQYLEALSSKEPIPGGGSVSAYVASLAMGLSQMVAEITLARKIKADLSEADLAAEQEKRGKIEALKEKLGSLKDKTFEVVDTDPKVYGEVKAAWGKSDEEMEAMLWKSYLLQAELCQWILEAKSCTDQMCDLVKGSIKNDLLVSQGLYVGAFKGAWDTSMINVKYMKDEAKKLEAEQHLSKLKEGLGEA